MKYDKLRFEHRRLAEKLGAYCVGYPGGHLQLAMPNKDMDLIIRSLKKLGWNVRDAHKMSLCSDKPNESLRHFGPYQNPKTDRPAYWYYWTFAHPDNKRNTVEDLPWVNCKSNIMTSKA
jgi:hypothetical protein